MPAINDSRHPRAEGTPIDTPRAFLGPNASHYDEAWRLMDWRDQRMHWNSISALGGPFWFAYRKMTVPAVIAMAILVICASISYMVFPNILFIVVYVIFAFLFGAFGNFIYRARFLSVSEKIFRKTQSEDERERRLQKAGGTSVVQPVVIGCLGLAGFLFMSGILDGFLAS